MTCASPAAFLVTSEQLLVLGKCLLDPFGCILSADRFVESIESCTCPARSRSTELMRRNKVCSRSSSTVGTFGSVALTFQDWTCNEEKAKMMFRDQNIDMSCQGQNKGTLSVIQPRGKGLQGRALSRMNPIQVSNVKSTARQALMIIAVHGEASGYWSLVIIGFY